VGFLTSHNLIGPRPVNGDSFYHMKILLVDFSANVVKGDISKPTIGNENLHEFSNDNGDRLVNFATTKNLRV
jgi:hypothetical protein